jgi:transposase-like protein
MKAQVETRELRGLAILAMGNQIKRLDPSTYRVKSQSGNGSYLVIKEGSKWICECPDHAFRGVECKHIHAVRFSLTLRERVTLENLGFDELCALETCKFCGSTNIIKRGYRKRRNGKVQRFMCKDCGRRFVVNEDGFHKMKYNPRLVTLALDLYFKGVSLRKIVDHLKQFYGFEVHFTTVLRWIQKYVEIMKSYVDELKPQVSDVWQTDEMKVRCGGKWNWLWNLMDSDTRFLLAMQMSKSREVEDARKVFAEAKARAKKKPKVVVTDGLPAYIKAFKKEFFTLKKPRIKHIRNVGFKDKTNNNLIERLHGTVRERNKVLRGLKQEESTVIEGLRVYYNFIRPHMSLNGKTPAEASNIDLNLERNRWLSLIRKALRVEKNG